MTENLEEMECIVPERHRKNIPIFVVENCGGPRKKVECIRVIKRESFGESLVNNLNAVYMPHLYSIWCLFPKF